MPGDPFPGPEIPDSYPFPRTQSEAEKQRIKKLLLDQEITTASRIFKELCEAQQSGSRVVAKRSLKRAIEILNRRQKMGQIGSQVRGYAIGAEEGPGQGQDRQAEIPRELARLGTELRLTQEAMESLAERLSPVTNTDSNSVGDQEEKELPDQTDIGHAIRSHRETVERIRNQIQSLYERLEI